jgi:GT2 family glycosyltransferase
VDHFESHDRRLETVGGKLRERIPVLGVVTVTYNSAGVLQEFLESLQRQVLQQFRLYAIDNRSVDSSVAMMSAALGIDITIIRNAENLGVAEGNNQGIRQAIQDGCMYVLLLNNDTVFESDLFATLMNVAQSGNHRIVVPKIYYNSRDHVIWCAGGYFVPWRGYLGTHFGDDQPDTGQFDVDRAVDYSPTCCMLVAKDIFDTVGLMDARYFAYYDDTDFCLRAMRRGEKIWYTHQTSLRHKVGSLTGGETSPFYARMTARNKVYYLRKNFGWLTQACLLMMFAAYIAGRWLTGRDSWSRFKIKARAFVDGFSV